MGILIDSTLLIFAERNSLSPAELIDRIIERHGNQELAASVMTAGELLHGCWRADTPERRARREEFVEAVLAVIPTIEITMPIVRVYAEIDARSMKDGSRLPPSDLLIAATALFRGDAIATANVRHFRRIDRLEVHAWS